MVSPSRAAARVDTLLEQVSTEFRNLPRTDTLSLVFREALTRVGLPGGYARRGAVPRPLVESLKGETSC